MWDFEFLVGVGSPSGPKSMASRTGAGDRVTARKGRPPRDLNERPRVGGVFELAAYAPAACSPVRGEELEAAIRKGALPFWAIDHLPKGLVPHSLRERVRQAFPRLGIVLPQNPLLWSRRFANIVVNTGLDDILDKFFKGSSYTAAHYVGISSSTPTFAASDTMSSHAGWTEVTGYSESTRQAFTPGTVASQSVDNSGSKAVVTANTSITPGGAFLTTNNTKGGTTGTLVAGGAFTSGNETLSSGDTLTITYTFGAADDGV